MNKPLFLKFFISFVLLIVLSSLLIIINSYQAIRTAYITQITETMAAHNRMMLPEVLDLLLNKHSEALQPLTKKYAAMSQTRITIIDTQGDVLADSSVLPSSMYNHRQRPEVAEALSGKTGRSVRISADLGHEMIYIALPVRDQNKIIGVIRFSLPAQETNALLATVRTRIILIALLGVLVSLVLSGFLSHFLSKPIREIQQAVEKITGGDFSVHVPHTDTSDEIGQLGRGFNLMTEHIRESFSDLSHRQEELQSILSIMSEGLLLLDAQGRITRSNASARHIFGRDDIDGKYYWEVLRSTFLSGLLEGPRSTNHISHELTLGGRVYLCNASTMPSAAATVLILFDITEIKNMEQIKRDLVMNVSHELNTPLTAIKGFTETLLEDAQGETQQYLTIIKRHADRLQNIVRDLLTLSELEEHGTALEKETVNLSALITSILSIFEQRLQDKNLELVQDIPAGLSFKADAFRLEQLFTNLIDNAIKYTETGGITIGAAKSGKNIVITIKDTGIGIASEHLARIFERFYTADKSHSRSLGGTGLGLSIAKHITTLHQGALSVDSTPNVGTTFTITLPVWG